MATETSKGRVSQTVFFLLAVVAMVFGLTVYQYTNRPVLDREQLQSMGAVVFERPRSFQVKGLVNHRGQPVTAADFTGGWGLVFFGFTSCQDVCPASLGQLNRLAQTLQEDNPELARQVRYIMVSVDPRRDTVARLGTYMPSFNPDFIGMTGTIEAIYDLTRQLNVAFTPVVEPENDNYMVDHSANLMVVNPQGDYYGFIRPPFEPDRLRLILTALDQGYRG